MEVINCYTPRITHRHPLNLKNPSRPGVGMCTSKRSKRPAFGTVIHQAKTSSTIILPVPYRNSAKISSRSIIMPLSTQPESPAAQSRFLALHTPLNHTSSHITLPTSTAKNWVQGFAIYPQNLATMSAAMGSSAAACRLLPASATSPSSSPLRYLDCHSQQR